MKLVNISPIETEELVYKLQKKWQSSRLPSCPKPGTNKTGFGQVKIMKEFAWVNRIFFKFGFRASRWKN
jgi:hypothetical protein